MTYRFVKFLRLIHLAGKSVNEEASFAVRPVDAGSLLDLRRHGNLEEFDGDLHRHNCTLLDVCPNQNTILRPFSVLFRT